MNYRIDIVDTWNRRIATFDEAPLLRVTRTSPDQADVIEGVLPGPVTDLSHGYRVRVYIDGALFAEAPIVRVAPQWSDTRKLVLDRFVYYHEVMGFEAVREALDGNTKVARAFINRPIHEIVRAAINTATGSAHYTVAHAAYPDGAERESAKFDTRRTPTNELGIGGITTGQWVGAGRINATGAFAKDGDTIAGLVVDGVTWPDLRLMMIDCEETSRNSHAESLHGEVAEWTGPQYNASGYKLKADAAKDFLQSLIASRGIDYIELNPHRDATGAFDDRVDAFGRYLGFVYGDGQCFNAAMVEAGHAQVYLYDEGKFHVPEMELKDYFSYSGVHTDSIATTSAYLTDYDVSGGLYEILAALAYAAGGYIWAVGPDGAISFREAARPDRVLFFDRVHFAVTLGSDSNTVRNGIVLKGHPLTPLVDKLYVNGESADEYGFQIGFLDYFSINNLEDGELLVEGLLEDVAYPSPTGEITYLAGIATVGVGDIVELRGDALRRLERELPGEWGGRFAGRIVGRVNAVTHEFRGRRATTTVTLTSPLRSVANPLAFIVRSQPPAESLFQFRLDDAGIGTDLGYHLD